MVHEQLINHTEHNFLICTEKLVNRDVFNIAENYFFLIIYSIIMIYSTMW